MSKFTRHGRYRRHNWPAMRLPALCRRWLVCLLVLAFSAGLGTSAFAGISDNGRHTATATAAHGTCLHAALDAGQQTNPDDASDISATADCALAHLGQALLDRPATYLIKAVSLVYPPAPACGLAGQVPGLEGDPPKPARTV